MNLVEMVVVASELDVILSSSFAPVMKRFGLYNCKHVRTPLQRMQCLNIST